MFYREQDIHISTTGAGALLISNLRDSQRPSGAVFLFLEQSS